jgi:hypothetical protein
MGGVKESALLLVLLGLGAVEQYSIAEAIHKAVPQASLVSVSIKGLPELGEAVDHLADSGLGAIKHLVLNKLGSRQAVE